MDSTNSTTFVKTAINVFICLAIGISLFQELNLTTAAAASGEQVKQVPEVNVNGTKVDGLVILSTDQFKKEFKELLIEKDYNLEIKDYPFEDTEYWINLFLTHGHMLVVFLLVSKFQGEQDQSRKTKLMILGMVLVFGWMFLSPQLKTQRLGLQYQGVRVYQRDDFSKEELITKISAYEEDSIFGLDPLPEPAAVSPSEPTETKQAYSQDPYVEVEQPINDF